ncbi:hypothetical protein BSKO_06857 [Bryopsis sp. KO-2023]|nr:hypothetical protein BSKO_06857 [Bryopsis sp. KO-2023]
MRVGKFTVKFSAILYFTMFADGVVQEVEMALHRACFVLVAILAGVAPIGADDPLKSTSGSPGGKSHKPSPSKCVFRNARWFCPGGGGNPPVSPQGCRCCEGPPVNTKACREQCALVDCAPPDCGCCGLNPSRTPKCQTECAATSCLPFPLDTPPSTPGPNPSSCRCCSTLSIDRPEGCGAVCAAVSCAAPITPPNPTVDDCGCCGGVRRNIPGCSNVCSLNPCPGAPKPPLGCGCCTNNQKSDPECRRLCGLRLCVAPPPVPVLPPKCDCCGPQKHTQGANTVSLTISGPSCDCKHVLCPQVDIKPVDG